VATAKSVLAGVVLSAAALVACGGGDPPALATELAIDDVPAAVEAVEAALGGPQQYTEINVGSDLVNLFVAADGGQELAYVYRGGTLSAPPAPADATLPAFDLTGVDLTVAAGLDTRLGAELGGEAELTRLALQVVDGAPRFVAVVVSSRGGALAVLVSGSGEILGVNPTGS
jgi:hypothetical protein